MIYFQNNSDNIKRSIIFPGTFVNINSDYQSLDFKQRDTLIIEIIGNDSQFHFEEATE